MGNVLIALFIMYLIVVFVADNGVDGARRLAGSAIDAFVRGDIEMLRSATYSADGAIRFARAARYAGIADYSGHDYASLIAPTGHAASQAPQSTHVSALTSKWDAPIAIAPTGHSPSQVPHATHSSEITLAMVSSSCIYL